MMSFSVLCRNIEAISCIPNNRGFHRASCRGLIRSLFRNLLFLFNPFITELVYFIMVSFLGYLALRITKPRTSFKPKDFDLFFTSVSSTTVSSMSTVEMEVFSNTQLIIMTILMLLGGEVFISLLGLLFAKSNIPKVHDTNSKVDTSIDQVELGLVLTLSEKPNIHDKIGTLEKDGITTNIKYNSIRYLAYVVLGYLLVIHIGGSSFISLYMILVPSASRVLKNKGIETQTFAVFTTVSTFANCGFVPTNENMVVFKNNSGLLLLLVLQVLLGNTLYPVMLRFVIWSLEKNTRRVEFRYLLKNHKELGYSHMLPGLRSVLLLVTVLVLITVQMILFCAREWKSEAMDGLSGYQKFVASLFVTVNSRHAGESVVDLSIISPAILVLFVFMIFPGRKPTTVQTDTSSDLTSWTNTTMPPINIGILFLPIGLFKYLPPYTTFYPVGDDCQETGDTSEDGHIRKPRKSLVESLIFSQLSYVAIFVILICITERQKMKQDPLNFNVLNIVVEVVSAYGNVGFSTGYSCERRLNSEGDCQDKWYGLVGRFSTKGKLLLTLVMFFGRLKKFSLKQGKAWKLS